MTSEAASRSSAQAAHELLIDVQLPRFDARSFHAVVVDAPPEAAYRAVRALDPQQVAQAVPAMQLMGWVRALPLRISARRRPERHEGIGHRPVGAGVISNHSSVKNPHSA